MLSNTQPLEVIMSSIFLWIFINVYAVSLFYMQISFARPTLFFYLVKHPDSLGGNHAVMCTFSSSLLSYSSELKDSQ
jgi:hypothetical protein